jgi:hypothetical protein
LSTAVVSFSKGSIVRSFGANSALAKQYNARSSARINNNNSTGGGSGDPTIVPADCGGIR